VSIPEIDSQAASATIAALEFVHSADLSPDGRYAAWSISRIEGDVEHIDLMLTEIGSTDSTVLVTGGKSTDPEFSPDGAAIAFLHADDGAAPQIHLLELTGRTTSALTSVLQGVAGRPRWSPDGRHIAFTVGPAPRDRDKPYRVTRAIPWRDGVGLVDDAINDVHVLNPRSKEITRLTNENSLIGVPEWHPDSFHLSFITSGRQDEWRHEGGIRTVDLNGNSTHIADLADIFSITVTDTGHVATSSGNSWIGATDSPTETFGRVFTIEDGAFDIRSAQLDINGDVVPDIPVPFADPHPRILMHGGAAIVRVQHRDRLELYRIPLTGDAAPALELSAEGSLYPVAIRGDLLLYGEGDRLTAPDLHVHNLVTGESTRVTDTASCNRRILTPLRVEHLWIDADRDLAVQATFLAPADSEGAQPTVLLMHGGPETAFGEALFLDAQLLCEAGMAVLLVNARGSRGYGHEFLTASRGDWGGVDADDFLAAVDLAVERGLADGDRLGLAGLSFGGYMTTWLIGHTDRFRAAVAENSVTNLVSLYGTSDIGMAFLPTEIGGSIGAAFEQYLKSSPIMSAEQVTTPTLLIVSSADHRCPPEQSLQFYHRLKSTGCEVEMVVLPGASHAGSVNEDPVVRRAQNDALVGWLADRLLSP